MKCDRLIRTAKRTLYLIAFVVLVVMPVLVFIGGIDAELEDDSDMRLEEGDGQFVTDGNGWSMLSNVLAHVEELNEGIPGADKEFEAYSRANDVLRWYVDPTNCEWEVIEALDDLCEDGDRSAHLFYNFTNGVRMCSFVEGALKTNAWLLAGIDQAVSASRFSPPPPGAIGEDWHGLQVCTLAEINRSFLLARLLLAFEAGDYPRAMECLRKNLRLASLLQTRCDTFLSYLVGAGMVSLNIDLVDGMLSSLPLPESTLLDIDRELQNLPGFSPEAKVHALKRAYAIRKVLGMRARAEGIQRDLPPLCRLLCRPFDRYMHHPNRISNADMAAIRKFVADSMRAPAGDCDACRPGRQWYDVLIPNSTGRTFAIDELVKRFRRMEETEREVDALRCKIAERRRMLESGFESDGYFPLDFADGCFYTHDRRRLLAVAEDARSIEIDGDIKIADGSNFSQVERLVVTNCCSAGFADRLDAFPNLRELIVDPDNAEIGVCGGCVYDKGSGKVLRSLRGGK